MNDPEETEVAANLRRRAETLLATKDEEISRMPAGSIRALVHELQVYEIELEMQNEELRQAQLDLADARDRYSNLYEFSPVGYVTFDAEGVVRGANLTAAKMLRIERSRLIGTHFGIFVRPQDRQTFSKSQAEVFLSGEKQSCELQMELSDKSASHFRLEVTLPGETPMVDPVCFTALIDITAQKAADELRLQQHSFRVSEAEKSRIARELHDDLGSKLKGLEVHASMLAIRLEAESSPQADDARKFAEWLDEAVCQTRDLAVGLNAVFETAALFPALKRLAYFAREAKIECHLRLPKFPIEFVDPSTANHLYRIAQEAVHNAVRHSGGSEMTLALEIDHAEVVLRVCDNGHGFDCGAVYDESLGLQIMRYRAKAIHGTLTILAGSSSGTQIACRLPPG